MICPTAEAEYFSQRDWTGGITLIVLAFFRFWRMPEIADARCDGAFAWARTAAARRAIRMARGGRGTISGLVDWAAVGQEI